MVYLDNKKDPQEVWIPRNDGNGYIHTGSSHSYQEGYEDGMEYQKSLLSSTTFTENGEYERENGWSAITVNVEPSLEEINVVISADTTTITPSSGYYGISEAKIDASGYAQENYDSGFDDGFNDGYSSGSSEGYESGYTEGYQSGSTDGYESGYTSGSTDGYESGYTEGYNSGYTSGETDGYNSGYTSGETHQKSLLGTTAFTINGSYSAENGYSAITVNVPTGETYNIEQNKPFTATSNGNYTITPSSGITTVTDRFDSDTDRYYITATASGYPLTGRYNIFYIEDEFDSSKGQIDVYIENGYLDYDDSDWYGGEIVDLSVSREIDLFIRNANRDFEWYPLEDFDYHYDAMSAVSLNVNIDTASTYQSGYTSGHTDGVSEEKAKLSAITFTANTAITISDGGYSAITVNVPQSGSTEKDIVICTSGDCWFVTNVPLNNGDTIEIEHCTFGKYGAVQYYHQQFISGNLGDELRIGQSEQEAIYIKYFDSSDSLTIPLPQTGTCFDDNTIVFSPTAFTIDGQVIGTYNGGGSDNGELIIFANDEYGGDGIYDQTAKIGKITIYDSNGDVKATLEPRLDEFNVPYFKYIEQDIDIYASGNTAPFYEEIILDPSYQSGYTDGYNSGYTDGYNSGTTDGYSDGENAIISTFTAMTATTNGVYGSSASPLSSITVNVQQVPTGVTYVDYLETDGGQVYWDTGISLRGATTGCVENRLIFMPLSGNSHNSVFVSDQSTATTNSYRTYLISADTSNNASFASYYNGDITSAITNGVKYDCSVKNVSGQTMEWDINGDKTETTVNNTSQRGTVLINATRYRSGYQSTIRYFAKARYYYLKLETNVGVLGEFKPALDTNGNPCFYDEISQTYLYHSGSGNVTYHITTEYESGYTDGQNSIISTFTAITATTNGIYGSSASPLSSITVNVPQTSFGDLYCLYCDEDCIFDFPYTINSELASIDDIHFSVLPLSDFTIVYKGDLDENNYKIGNMKWTDEGNGYYHFSGNWETNYYTYSTNDSTSREMKSFPNMHFFDWKIYATKTYTVDSDDLTISNGGGAPTHTSDLSISGNAYYLGNVSVDNQYCLWHIAVDSDGNGCLNMGNEYKYPRQGNCYPVYRKLVNGDYVYRVVKPISVGGV